MRHGAVVAAVSCVAIVGCRPELGERESRLEHARVLAVRVEPPEARAGDPVTVTVLAAGADGPVDDPATDFAFCATPKLLTENGSVSAACQRDGVIAIGRGRASIAATLPADACFVFGPETGDAALRPRDPDTTGGFYQPIRARVLAGDETLTAFGFARIGCTLAATTAAAAARYRAEYRPNTNPRLLPLEARADGAAASFEAIPRGARVVLRARWDAAAAEDYVSLDETTQTLVPRREAMRVTWFATDGTLERDRTGRDESDRETTSDDPWTAPEAPTTAHLFVVLRDARGGVAFTNVRAVVR